MYNYRGGPPPQMHSLHSDYFRAAESSNTSQPPYYFRHPSNLSAAPVTTAQPVRMSQAGYNSGASGSGGGGHSMQPSHGAHHQAPGQPMAPPHAGVTYHQQQASGPPYVIGPGQYNSSQQQQQFAYRQQLSPYQQHQSPSQQQQHPQQQPGRPLVGINAIPSSQVRMPLPTSQHSSPTPYLVQQQQNSPMIRAQPQQSALSAAIQQAPGQASFMPARSVAVSSAHHPQQQMMVGAVGQPQLVRVQSHQPQQVLHQAAGSTRMVAPGQVHVIATSPSGMVMPTQYTQQGVYQRPVILQQQPIVVQQLSQQQPTIQYQAYKPQQPALQSQLQQGLTPQQQQPQPVLPKQQPTPSPSSIPSSSSSTPAPQFAAPNQVVKPEIAGATSSPSPAAGTSGGTDAISDSAAAAIPGVQSDSNQVLTKQRLDDLVREVDPYEQLDDDVKDTLLHIADEFIESVVSSACQIAKHRKATTVDVKDVQLCLERNWNMWIPGFGSDDIRPYKKACVTDAHKQRTALIKKTLKKI